MPVHKSQFPSSDLPFIAKASEFEDPRELPLRIGDRVKLNSGGPSSLIVDVTELSVTTAWPGGECVYPRGCIHRVRD